MPRKTGFEIIEEVRKQNVNPKFIFVTGFNQYAIKAIRAAAFDFLVKPVDIYELKDTFDRYYEELIGTNSNRISKHLIEKYNLTKKEVEIINFLIVGISSKQIAEELFISKHTVNTHRRHILDKSKFHTTVELIGFISSKLN